MTTTKYILILTSLSLALNAAAQKKQYTMAEATNGIVTNLAPKGLKGANWRPGTHQFFLKSPEEKAYSVYDVNTEKISLSTNYFHEAREWQDGYAWITNQSWFKQSADTVFITTQKEKDNHGYTLTETKCFLPKGANSPHFNATGTQAAFTVNNNLFVRTFIFSDKPKGEMIEIKDPNVAVTSDTNLNIINGQSVHRNEFGITDGIFWSPKGNYLAYYRMDQTMVNDYPVIDWSKTPAVNTNVKYPMAGGTSHQVTVRVYNPKTEKTIELQTGKGKDHYLTCITWSPDEKYIYIAILNRGQNHMWLNQYDAQTGEKIKTLFEETDPKYVEPQHPLSFLPGNNDQFIWWSQRDGYMHLYLCDLKSNTMKCLTPGNYVVNELLAFNKERSEIVFTSAKEDPREKHGYTVNWKTGEMRRIDKEPGTHNFTASDDGKYVFDVLTAKGVAKKSMIRATDGSMTKVLVDSPDPLADYDRPEIKDKKLKADDGTILYGKLILPTHFDPTKKYPVIVYLYNGPHVQQIKNGFPESGNLWYEYLAQHGYIVWTMDGRGSSNRGLKFEQAVFRQLGTKEMDDQMVGVNFLKSLPYVDGNRLGIHGWSFGGFMTTSFMLRKPGVFKVAVAGGPVMDWSMYEIMYGERYMDTPQENPKGYADNNLFTKVKNLKGKLMLIHGTQDATVVWQQSIKFLKASVDEGVQVDYFVYPGYEHNVRGKDRVHLMQKVTDYFDANL